MENKFQRLFSVKKPIIGMIHLAGNSLNEKIGRALNELEIYQSEGVDGAVVEDYHADGNSLISVLKEISKKQWNLKLGVNYLRDPNWGFELAQKYGASFVQIDSVDEDLDRYSSERKTFPNLAVLGGVRFKYQPSTGKSLEEDIVQGKSRCDAIVTTGDGTGLETPIEKLKQFKHILPNFPLIVGAGVDYSNVIEQLMIADSAIVGSYFKPEKNTYAPVGRELVREFMDRVKEVR